MAEETHELSMEMTCDGCANAAKKVLGKLAEVSKVETDVEKKRVYVSVKDAITPEKLLEQLQKTGKECAYIGKLW